jgi:hypothetical protein
VQTRHTRHSCDPPLSPAQAALRLLSYGRHCSASDSILPGSRSNHSSGSPVQTAAASNLHRASDTRFAHCGDALHPVYQNTSQAYLASLLAAAKLSIAQS